MFLVLNTRTFRFKTGIFLSFPRCWLESIFWLRRTTVKLLRPKPVNYLKPSKEKRENLTVFGSKLNCFLKTPRQLNCESCPFKNIPDRFSPMDKNNLRDGCMHRYRSILFAILGLAIYISVQSNWMIFLTSTRKPT